MVRGGLLVLCRCRVLCLVDVVCCCCFADLALLHCFASARQLQNHHSVPVLQQYWCRWCPHYRQCHCGVCSVAIRLLCPLLISVVVPLQRNPTIETLRWDHKLAPLLKGALPAELHDAGDKAVLVYLRSIRHSSVVVNRATLLFVGYASCFGSVLSLFFLFGHLTRCSLPSLSPLL